MSRIDGISPPSAGTTLQPANNERPKGFQRQEGSGQPGDHAEGLAKLADSEAPITAETISKHSNNSSIAKVAGRGSLNHTALLRPGWELGMTPPAKLPSSPVRAQTVARNFGQLLQFSPADKKAFQVYLDSLEQAPHVDPPKIPDFNAIAGFSSDTLERLSEKMSLLRLAMPESMEGMMLQVSRSNIQSFREESTALVKDAQTEIENQKSSNAKALDDYQAEMKKAKEDFAKSQKNPFFRAIVAIAKICVAAPLAILSGDLQQGIHSFIGGVGDLMKLGMNTDQLYKAAQNPMHLPKLLDKILGGLSIALSVLMLAVGAASAAPEIFAKIGQTASKFGIKSGEKAAEKAVSKGLGKGVAQTAEVGKGAKSVSSQVLGYIDKAKQLVPEFFEKLQKPITLSKTLSATALKTAIDAADQFGIEAPEQSALAQAQMDQKMSAIRLDEKQSVFEDMKKDAQNNLLAEAQDRQSKLQKSLSTTSSVIQQSANVRQRLYDQRV